MVWLRYHIAEINKTIKRNPIIENGWIINHLKQIFLLRYYINNKPMEIMHGGLFHLREVCMSMVL